MCERVPLEPYGNPPLRHSCPIMGYDQQLLEGFRVIHMRATQLILASLCGGLVGLLNNALADSPSSDLGIYLDSPATANSRPTPTSKFGHVSLTASRGFVPARLSAVLSSLDADTTAWRGATEVRLYADVAPGVVLIATDDALGSGSVINPSGLVLTNLHVVGNNSTVAVVFKPHVEGDKVTKADVHRGTVIRRDQVADLALVQVADVPANVKVIPLAAMTDISVGSDVHAIGHPTGEAWSYTKGIVSQVRRNYEWTAEDGLKHKASVIQTQTPINPGNSGGPLLTDAGTLVGVNSFKSEGEGLNFAVSVDDVRVLLNEKIDRLIKVVRTENAGDSCELKSYGVTRLKDGSGTRELLDVDCSGKPDAAWILPDATSEPGRLELDTNHNGKINGVLISKNRDGKWDYSIWDTTGSGKPDIKCFHEGGNAKPSRCEKISAGP